MEKKSRFEPCYWVVKETLLSERKAGRIFRIDVANIGYRESISLNALFRKRRNWKGKERLYTYGPEEEHDLMTKDFPFNKFWPKERITVTSVAELFQLIGYDRKTKKWQSTSPS